MDGTLRRTLVKEHMLWPTGLAIDYHAHRLYWADAKKLTIETVDLDGQQRKTVVTLPHGLCSSNLQHLQHTHKAKVV